jgi:hypothetical protein
VAGEKLNVQTLFGQLAAVGMKPVTISVNDPYAEPVKRLNDSPGCAEPIKTSATPSATLELIPTECVPLISQSVPSVHAAGEAAVFSPRPLSLRPLAGAPLKAFIGLNVSSGWH